MSASEKKSAAKAAGGYSPGPGLRAALAALGDSGLEILRAWRRTDPSTLRGLNNLASAPDPQARAFAEARLGTRWLAYGHGGVAYLVLRQAGRRS